MQLYSVEQKRSQALEAHAAAFSTIKVHFMTTRLHLLAVQGDLLRLHPQAVMKTQTRAMDMGFKICLQMQVPSRDRPSTVIAFAQKTFKDGNLTSKLHVIELGAPAGAYSTKINRPAPTLPD